MKTKSHSLLLVWLFFGVFIFVEAAAHAQPPQPTPSIPTRQGIFTRLIEIKYTSELFLSIALKQGDNKDTALAIYNTMRWKIDGLVYQLSGDMIASNSPRAFILLDKWCLRESDFLNDGNRHSQSTQINKIKIDHYKPRIKIYILALQEIEAFYQNNIIEALQGTNPSLAQISSRPKTLNLTTNVFYLLKDSYSIVKGISDLKTQKTMALVELLDHNRLMSPGEVGKAGR